MFLLTIVHIRLFKKIVDYLISLFQKEEITY